MRLNILFGGAAGQGPNILTHLLAESLVKKGYYCFYSRDYQSLIRGGHNFNVLTISDEPVFSNDYKIDVLVCLDNKTKEIHKDKLKDDSLVLEGEDSNMYFAGRVFKVVGLDFSVLDEELKLLEKRYEENLENAKKGYEDAKANIELPEVSEKKLFFNNGNQGISFGAIDSGLDIYMAYPMTPATSVLNDLAQLQYEKDFLVLELENEISVAISAIGAAATGAKVMVGTSGGGFDLMSEGLSFAGVAGTPLVAYLSQRPGPASGVATYTAQGDLKMALGTGHGEFNRVVLAPGSPREAYELTNQCFYFANKFKIPTIVLGDKHLAESFYSTTSEGKKVDVEKSVEFGRFNSYEKDEKGGLTEDPKVIIKNIEERKKIGEEIKKESEKFVRYNIYGNEDSENVILGWGSTKGAIIDAIKDLDVKFVQILYMDPFPEDVLKELEGKKLILVENNATGQLADLISGKLCLKIEEKNKILRYDGRPFNADELKKELEGRV